MTDQQMPIPGNDAVYPVALDAFTDMLAGRRRIGIDRYGIELMTHNGRDALQDLFEEIVDAWQYAVQARLERDDLVAENVALRAEVARLTGPRPAGQGGSGGGAR